LKKTKKSFRSAQVLITASALVATAITFPLQAQVSQPKTTVQSASYGDTEIDRQVEALLAKMTIDEKIGQLTQTFEFTKMNTLDDRIAAGQIGSFIDIMDPAEMDRLQRIAIEKSRLHIPLMFGMDLVHGYRTIFPVPIGAAASWDMNMIQQEQELSAQEARHLGITWAFAPMLDIVRDPRWGRILEGAGEDPYLGSKVAAAQVHGLQGSSPNDASHVLACAKHFAGYGAVEGGRDHEASNLSESQLRNVYFKPFHAAVDGGVGCVMSAYMDLNDVPSTGNHWLLTDVLRDEWKFKGMVISDNNAVTDLVPHGFAKDMEDAGVRAINAGVDVQMSNFGDVSGLLAGVRDGRVKTARLDEAVRRILKAKFEYGVFDHPYVGTVQPDREALAKQLQAARNAADRSAVLLRNEGNLLPLHAGAYKKIAVIGQIADSRQDTVGPWSLAVDIDQVVTVRHAVEIFEKDAAVSYAQGYQIQRHNPSPFIFLMKEQPQKAWTREQSDAEFKQAVDLASDSDLVIAVIGELQDMTGESASRAELDLPGRQEELLKAITAMGKPIVAVLFNGRPLDIRWEAEHIPAIMEMWYPGTEGGNAAADVLWGRANPAGKLPVTWPRGSEQVPTYYSHTLTQDPENQGDRYWDVPSTPLFPFGFGLSYTKFSFATPKVVQPQVKVGQPVTVETEIENKGEVAGDVVAQLYIHQRFGSASRPVRELKGFDRVSLQPHEKKTVRFTLSPEDLSFWSTAKKGWTQEPTVFDLWVGEDSTAVASGSFTVNP
jgi:beta-glucosidase